MMIVIIQQERVIVVSAELHSGSTCVAQLPKAPNKSAHGENAMRWISIAIMQQQSVTHTLGMLYKAANAMY